MTVPRARRDPRLRRFVPRRHKLHTAGGALNFVAPRSSADLLGRGAGRSRDPAVAHWAQIWPASVAVARHLTRGPSLAGRTVLDLGCGIGVAGTAAGVHGAAVVFADREPDAIHFAAFNAAWNRVSSSRAISYDWDVDEPPSDVDIVVMADLAYEYRNHLPLLRQIAFAVEGGASVLFADPHRPTATDLFARAEQRFRVDRFAERVHFDGARASVRMMWIRGAHDRGAEA